MILAIVSVAIALVFVSTFSFQVYVPATRGYFNFGDIMIFVFSLTFGPIVGGLAGGIGSSLSDALSGSSAVYAPYTLVIKGVEGVVAGQIARINFRGQIITAWLLGGIIMISGYFVAESLFIVGYPASLADIPVNILQIAAGGVVGIPVSRVLERRLPEALLSLKRMGARGERKD